MSLTSEIVLTAIVLVLLIGTTLPLVSSILTGLDTQNAEAAFNKLSSGIKDAYLNNYAYVDTFSVPSGWSIFYFYPHNVTYWTYQNSEFTGCQNHETSCEYTEDAGALTFVRSLSHDQTAPACFGDLNDYTKTCGNSGDLYLCSYTSKTSNNVFYEMFPYQITNPSDGFYTGSDINKCGSEPCLCLAYGDFEKVYTLIRADFRKSSNPYDTQTQCFELLPPSSVILDITGGGDSYSDFLKSYESSVQDSASIAEDYFFSGYGDLMALANLGAVNQPDLGLPLRDQTFKIKKCVPIKDIIDTSSFTGRLFYDTTTQPIIYFGKTAEPSYLEIQKRGNDLVFNW